MTTKIVTNIEQSKKLAEILPPESADMIWVLANPDLPMIKAIAYEDSEKSKYYEILPAWSLAALLGIIPNPIICTHFVTHKWEGESYKVVNHQDGLMEIEQLVSTEGFDNPVDACVAMIEKLHKLKML